MIGLLLACASPSPPLERWRVVVAEPGADAAELEARAATLESALAPLGPVRSRFGDGSVTVEVAAPDPLAVRDALPISPAPEDQEIPEIQRVGSAEVRFVVSGDAADLDGRLVPALERLPYVGGIDRCGGGAARLAVVVDPAKAAARALTLRDVLRGLAAAAPAAPTPDLPLTADVRLGDVATVERGRADAPCRAVGPTGPAEVAAVRVGREGADGVDAALRELGAQVGAPAGLELRYDPADTAVVDAVARAVGAVALDARDGSARVLAGSDALARVRAVPGVVGAWEVHQERLRVVGPAWEELDRHADAVRDALRAAGIHADRADPPPRRTVDLTIDRDRAEALGVDPADVALAAAAAVGGAPAGRASDGESELPIVLRLGGAALDPASPGDWLVPTGSGALRFADLASYAVGAERIRVRVDGQRVVELVVDGPAAAARDVAAALAAPEGVRLEVAP